MLSFLKDNGMLWFQEKMTLMEKSVLDSKLSERWNNKVEPAHNYGNIS